MCLAVEYKQKELVIFQSRTRVLHDQCSSDSFFLGNSLDFHSTLSLTALMYVRESNPQLLLRRFSTNLCYPFLQYRKCALVHFLKGDLRNKKRFYVAYKTVIL